MSIVLIAIPIDLNSEQFLHTKQTKAKHKPHSIRHSSEIAKVLVNSKENDS